MNVRSWAAATALSIGAVAGAWSQAISLRPGEYEAVVEFQLPGETQPMVMEHLACVTSVEAADLLKVITEGMAEEDGCEVSNFKQSARTVSFEMTCDVDGQRVLSTAQMTFDSDSYTSTMTMNMGKEQITGRGSGRWVRATCSSE